MDISETVDFTGRTADVTDHAGGMQGSELKQYHEKVAILRNIIGKCK